MGAIRTTFLQVFMMIIVAACGELPTLVFETGASSTISNTKFVTTWRTTSTNQNVTLPLVSGYTYNFVVDWGDNSTDTVVAWNDPNASHIYSSIGTYTVTIAGTLEAFVFDNTGSKDALISVDNLGHMGWLDFRRSFRGCLNLATFTAGDSDTSLVTTMEGMFWDADALITADLSGMNTSNVTQMGFLFRAADLISSVDISSFDTSKVRNMGGMFINTIALTGHLDLSNFQTPELVSMNMMFQGSAISSVNLSSFNTPKLDGLFRTFRLMPNLTSLDLSSFNTTNVLNNMNNTFEDSNNLTSINLSNFDITSAGASLDTFTNTGSNGVLVVSCNQGGPAGTGTFLTEACN